MKMIFKNLFKRKERMSNDNEEIVEGENEILDEVEENIEETTEVTAEGMPEEVNTEVEATENTEEEVSNGTVLEEVEVAKYRVIGLIDYTDEQGNIIGQLQMDSIQEFPTDLGDSYVEDGRAEKVE